MATLNQTTGSLSDLLKLMQDGSPVRRVAELATRDSDLINKLPWVASNGDDGHLVAFQSALPRPTWVAHNQGVKPVKGSTDTYVETFGRAEQRFAIPKSLTERNGGDFMKAQQIRMAVLGMKQDITEKAIYSSSLTNPEQFAGFIPRLNSLSGPWQKQIVNHNAAAAGNDQASILLIKPGEGACHFIYPRGSPAGISYTKLNDDYEDDGAGSGAKVLCERGHFVWRVGLAIEDARCVVRVGNVDQSALSLSSTSIVDAMIDALEKFPGSMLDGAFFLMSRTVRAQLRKQKNWKNIPITVDEVEGKRQLMFDETPIYADDLMLLTEAPIGA